MDKFTGNAVIGRLNINLANNNLGIKDQTNHDLWLDLFDPKGVLTVGQIHIQI